MEAFEPLIDIQQMMTAFASAKVKPRLKSEAAEVGMRSKMVACWFSLSYLQDTNA